MYPALTAVFQMLGAAAIFVSMVGTWMAARHRRGWLLCVVSSTMWFPALISGNQWAAVANCVLSIGICARNFQAQAVRTSTGEPGVEADLVGIDDLDDLDDPSDLTAAASLAG